VKFPIYQLDAFAAARFTGNPAAVCPLPEWLPDEVLQSVAAENNLSETAFFVQEAGAYRLRWFTPEAEVDLCGHATLAAAAVVTRILDPGSNEVNFRSRGGDLRVTSDGELLVMDFPARPGAPVDAPTGLLMGLGVVPREVLVADYYLAVFDSIAEIEAITPDFERLARLDRIGVIVSAAGRDVDFVSRFFAPAVGVPEDPVTGSAHCTLTPYWSERLGRKKLRARQLSRRGGELICEDRGERVSIAGRAVLYLKGEIFL
jgi:predicted PhzF superfamily epimerase YddE/YHI9